VSRKAKARRHRETGMSTQIPWPTEFRLSDQGRLLKLSFDDGTSHELPAEYLRVESPSAEVQGHGPGQRTTQFGKRKVAITEIVPTGNYAVRLIFDDHHSTGIYSFAYLHELAVDREAKWRAYLDELKAKGLRRDAVTNA
jgi:DUF971 family protein